MSDQMYFLAAGAVAVYLAPAAIAWFRFHSHAAAIAALNVFLGWTLLGWVVALVWAFLPPRPRRPEQDASG